MSEFNSELGKLASESQFSYDNEQRRHNWECKACNAKMSSETVSGKPTQFGNHAALATLGKKVDHHMRTAHEH